eukprot:CAMPEP_0185408566 /NCGR_PEP_ID=MMETSP1365-20130426/1999_1 /TAXON_ID=38817 /ORGANISM="Gephyrocapsa oceanica, Strain RCC1303" /LENGTH=54 /DNA_ID=CAMNT_0028011079 /DNA_START=69 /DNA_END=230 /DNA_ORIENTATION=+
MSQFHAERKDEGELRSTAEVAAGQSLCPARTRGAALTPVRGLARSSRACGSRPT